MKPSVTRRQHRTRSRLKRLYDQRHRNALIVNALAQGVPTKKIATAFRLSVRRVQQIKAASMW